MTRGRFSFLNSEWIWISLGLAVLSLAFPGDFLRPPPGQYLGGSDVVSQLIQALRLARDELLAGRWPTWNPYLASGVPLWANPQPALLYPPTWLLLTVPWWQGISLLKVFHLFWTGLGTYVWARVHRFGVGGALVGALVFSYCGFMTVRFSAAHPNFSAAIAWLPWAMAALEHSLRRRTVGSALLTGLPLAMSVYAGNPAGTYLVWGLSGIWTLAAALWPSTETATARERWGLPVRQLGLAVLAAVLLSAAQLLPSAELILRSARGQGVGYDFVAEYSLPLAHLISILVPNFFGEPVRLGYWGEFGHTEYVLYPGLLALLLTGAAVRHGGQERLVRLWLLLAVVSLLLALGPAGGLHPLAYRLVPGVSLVRAPTRFALWALFGVATLAAWAVDHLAQHPERRWGTPLAVTMLAGVPLALGVMAFLAYTLAPSEDARAYHIGAGLLQVSLLLALGGALLAGRPHLHAKLFVGLAALLVVADLWGYGVRELQLTEEGADTTWSEAAAVIGPTLASPPPRVLPWGLQIFQQNLAMDAGLASALIYDPLTLADYRAFVDSVPDPRATTFDLLSAEYLLIPADQDQWRAEPGLKHLGQAGEYAVYRRRTALPRAWVARETRAVANLAEALTAIHSPGFDSSVTALVSASDTCPAGAGGSARITSFAPSALTVEARGGGVLVLSETWYPGWQATLDGRPARVFPVDGVLRGVCVPEGSHTVRFSFDPPLVKVGVGITSVAMLGGGGLLGAWARRRWRPAPPRHAHVNAPASSGV